MVASVNALGEWQKTDLTPAPDGAKDVTPVAIDIDDDGDMDIVVHRFPGTISVSGGNGAYFVVYENDGSGAFAPSDQLAETFESWTPTQAMLYSGDCFDSSTTDNVGCVGGLTLADVNSDGLVDIVTGSKSGNGAQSFNVWAFTLYENTSTGFHQNDSVFAGMGEVQGAFCSPPAFFDYNKGQRAAAGAAV